MRRRHGVVIAAVAAMAMLFSGCSSSASEEIRPETTESVTISVPTDTPSIQAAVDAAQPGDTIEIGPGTYEESVDVRTDDLIVRGTERNDVVLDGGHVKSNGIVVTGDGVRVENLTVQNYTLNGVLVTGLSDESGGLARGSDGYERFDPEQFPPVQGFAVRYVTAANNGLYGIYAFNSQHGLLAHNYASGSSDSGIYVGQCTECDIVVRDNVAEYNAVGYEHTNASDLVRVLGNRFSDNRLGMTLLSDYQEAFIPLTDVYVAGNVIADNSNAETPTHAEGGFGVGVGIAGATNIELVHNLITGNQRAGVEMTSSEDLPPMDNSLIDNSFDANGLDLLYAASERAPGSGNCLQGDVGETSPQDAAETWTCPEGHEELVGEPVPAADAPEGLSYRDVPPPGDQPTVPADDAFDTADATTVDLDNYPLPEPDLLESNTRAAGSEG